ncbi:MAG: chorismate-binding protein [Opitutaceae bacterium]|nr:chorismate-binding protein [Cytophagales bacterium]
MKQYNLKTDQKLLLGDTLTPVSIYLKLRDKFPNSFLLESSDYHGNEDIFSYICCKPIAGIIVEGNSISSFYPDGIKTDIKIEESEGVKIEIEKFTKSFSVQHNSLPFITSGVFGYTAFDAVRHFEDIDIKSYETEFRKIPDIQYHVFQFVIAFNHFNNEIYIIENRYPGVESVDNIESIKALIMKSDFASYKFSLVQREESNFTDEQFLKVLEKGKEHCRRGDVFQIVLSRRFSRQYKGDDFNVYRSLRSVNPSPYLFYFDYGSFRIFGSSPEAQIVIKNDKAVIYPIAGTFRRSGDDTRDAQLAEQLLNDPKENAEHVMLVDLARNDLSRHGENVKVETFKEVQYYSHVIHLVSKVSGKLAEDHKFMDVVGDTFPAGTLSGAPKHMALKLINRYEHGNRGFYGGCIGYMSFKGEYNHAIMIRSIMSKDNVLYYQAGAGVVDLSIIENELQEVNNKLAALKKAIIQAEHI